MNLEAYHFSKREKEVLRLLLQGLSNRQIAARLGITEHTVEFHVSNLYRKLGVSSRPETFVKLGKTPGLAGEEKPGESGVEIEASEGDNDEGSGAGKPPLQATFLNRGGSHLRWERARQHFKKYILPGAGFTLLAAVLIVIFARQAGFERYERECENPDEASVGQTLARKNASQGKVHGQFGTQGAAPWEAKAGFVVYRGIRVGETTSLFLRLNYSKNSPASTLVLVYLDEEAAPRASIALEDLGDWERFEWSEPVYLGKVRRGVHALKLTTQGQQYGTADLDQLVLTSEVP